MCPYYTTRSVNSFRAINLRLITFARARPRMNVCRTVVYTKSSESKSKPYSNWPPDTTNYLTLNLRDYRGKSTVYCGPGTTTATVPSDPPPRGSIRKKRRESGFAVMIAAEIGGRRVCIDGADETIHLYCLHNGGGGTCL